jgi:transposase InsO family protein
MTSDFEITRYLRITPLDANNWNVWKTRFTSVLTLHNLENHLTDDPPMLSTPATLDEEEKLTKWEDAEKKCIAILKFSVSDGELSHLSGATTTKAMWRNLTDIKEPKGILAALQARRHLLRMIATEGTPMSDHITAFRTAMEKLNTMGDEYKISDRDFALLIITSLPDSWDSFVTSYFGSKAESKAAKITSSELIELLISEDLRRCTKAADNEIANTTRNSKFMKKGGKPPLGPACSNCKKPGHTMQDCWSKGGGKEGQGPYQKEKKKVKSESANQTTTKLPDIAYMAKHVGPVFQKDDWLVDSGATCHVATRREMFRDFIPGHGTLSGHAEGMEAESLGRGTVVLNSVINGENVPVTLKDVLYSPTSRNCLLSIGLFDIGGGTSVFGNGTLSILNRDKKTLLEGKRVKDLPLYLLSSKAAERAEEYANFTSHKRALTWDEWHRALGHLSITSIEKLAKSGLVTGLDIDPNSKPSLSCEACIKGKSSHQKFPKEAEDHGHKSGDLTYSDLWGPARTPSIGLHKYYIQFTDDASRHCTIRFLKDKTEAFDRIKDYVALVENKLGRPPKYMRFDSGSEYVNHKVRSFCASKGIEVQFTAPYSHEQHGIAERFNRTLIELARSMLIAKGLPVRLWAEAVSYAAYIRNRVQTRALKDATPEEMWSGKKQDISHLREFGSEVYVIDEGERSKLDAKACKHTFVGFEDGPRAIRYYDVHTKRVKISRNAFFIEDIVDSHTEIPIPLQEKVRSDLPLSSDTPIEGERTEGNQAPSLLPSTPSTTPRSEELPDSENLHTSTNNPSPIQDLPQRSTRARMDINYKRMNEGPMFKPRKPQIPSRQSPELPDSDELEISETAHLAFAMQSAEQMADAFSAPDSLREAKNSDEWIHWERAIQAENDLLAEKGTWTLEDLPPDKNLLKCGYVFAKKYDAEGNLRYKARLVVKGYSQIPGQDFNETYAPVMRMESMRTILALAAALDLDLGQMDIKGAYLNGDLKEEIYMAQPEGNDDGSGRVCRLRKTLYGLKQSGREWNNRFNSFMTDKAKFTCLTKDFCVYFRWHSQGIDLVAVWVDDLLIATKGRLILIRREILAEFEGTDQGEPRLLLGIEIHRDRSAHTITISQGQYIRKVLQRFAMSDSHPVSTPVDHSIHLDPANENNRMNASLYQQAVGSIMYAAVGTRPDLAFAIQTLSQFNHDPSNEHWTAVKRVLRYLKGTTDFGITYDGTKIGDSINVEGYSDSDWASNHINRRSISGYTFLMSGGAISWSSKKQPTVALSSMEGEYMAVTHAWKQLKWHRDFWNALGFPQLTPSILRVDNKAAILLANNPEHHNRSKHIDTRYHRIRDEITAGTVDLVWCPTDDEIADIFTKPLPPVKFTRFRAKLGMRSR